MSALSGILLGLSAAGQYAQQRKQGEYTASQLDVNAGLADRQAADAITRGNAAAARQKQTSGQIVGANKVALANQGVTLDGTAGEILAETEQIGELDRLTLLNNARREAWGYQVEAATSRAQGEQVRTASRNAARTTLLTAASQLYAMKPASAPKSVKAIDPGVRPVPGVQQTYNAAGNLATNNFSGLTIRQPRRPR